ncbi:MAG: hypothetical protein ACM3SY_14420 [Candidatus Omnitrophota bacterium]
MYPDENGILTIALSELERVVIDLSSPGASSPVKGYARVGDQLNPLPVGSTLDEEQGIFYWQPGVGFIGEYRFVFFMDESNKKEIKREIKIIIRPKTN